MKLSDDQLKKRFNLHHEFSNYHLAIERFPVNSTLIKRADEKNIFEWNRFENRFRFSLSLHKTYKRQLSKYSTSWRVCVSFFE